MALHQSSGTSSYYTTHRYEREYGKGQRSVLKKILEQDERASRAMILCVAEVLRPEASAAQQGALSLTVCPFLMRAAASGEPCPQHNTAAQQGASAGAAGPL